MGHLNLNGNHLRRYERPGVIGWTCLEVKIGDEVYQATFRRMSAKCHTMPDEPAAAASLTECAEVAARIFIAASV